MELKAYIFKKKNEIWDGCIVIARTREDAIKFLQQRLTLVDLQDIIIKEVTLVEGVIL